MALVQCAFIIHPMDTVQFQIERVVIHTGTGALNLNIKTPIHGKEEKNGQTDTHMRLSAQTAKEVPLVIPPTPSYS